MAKYKKKYTKISNFPIYQQLDYNQNKQHQEKNQDSKLSVKYLEGNNMQITRNKNYSSLTNIKDNQR